MALCCLGSVLADPCHVSVAFLSFVGLARNNGRVSVHLAVAEVEVLLDNYKISIMAIEQGRNADGTWHQQPGTC